LSSLYAATLSPPAPVMPDPPGQIPYQGYLQQNGTPVNTPVTMSVALFNQGETTARWNDRYPAVPVNNGHFNIVIGGPPLPTPHPVPREYFDGSQGSGTPLELEITIEGTTSTGTPYSAKLTPRQTLYPAPYSIASASANRSAGGFAVNGQLNVASAINANGPINIQNDRKILFQLDSGDDPNAGGIDYRPPGAPGALTISGAGKVGHPRVVNLYDDVNVSGNLTANSLAPTYDSGWFKVTSDYNTVPCSPSHGDSGAIYYDSNHRIVLNHNKGFIPSHLNLLSCGNLTPDGTACTSRIIVSGESGYHDSGADLNPHMITSDAAGNAIYLSMIGHWWAYAVWDEVSGWTFGDLGATTAYYRVQAWR
jgi:hypothetical protein